MTRENLERARDEAAEFIRRAETLLERSADISNELLLDNVKQSGALRRQSMELTRALADLRRS